MTLFYYINQLSCQWRTSLFQAITLYFIHFRILVAKIKKAVAENKVEHCVKSYAKYKLLIIDELGYLPVDKIYASVFFQLVAARYEKKSTIITTNQPLSKWGEVVDDPVIVSLN